ncbi:MAG: hypothetical protein WDZ91_06755 [Paenibacillaceae bacterium]
MTSETRFFQQLVLQAIQFCKKANIAIVQQEYTETKENILFTYSSYIQLSGAFQGIALISLEPSLAKAWVKHYVTFKFHEGDWELFASDVTAELINIFAGNSLEIRDDDDIQMGTPWLTTAKWIKSLEAVQYTQTLHTEYGAFICVYLHLEPTINPETLFTTEVEA